MVNDIIPNAIIALPQPPDGWFDYGYAALWNGELALLRVDCDIRAALAQRQNEIVNTGIIGPRPMLTGVRLRLSTFDGVTESAAIVVPAGTWPRVDRLPDGRWLVVSDSSDDLNARLYAADGLPAGAFAMGDYIAHIQCAIDGTIWAGYIDQGALAGEPAISSAGIARFDAVGQVIWRFNRAGRELFVFDCYAMTLSGAGLWTCFYTDFPIVRIEQGIVTHWRNKNSGAKALAVDDDYVLLAGGYQDRSSLLVLLELADVEARFRGRWRFTPPDPGKAGLVQGRDEILHVVREGQWRRISVTELRARRRHSEYRPDESA